LVEVAEVGDGDLYCLDVGATDRDGECPVLAVRLGAPPTAAAPVAAPDFGAFLLDRMARLAPTAPARERGRLGLARAFLRRLALPPGGAWGAPTTRGGGGGGQAPSGPAGRPPLLYGRGGGADGPLAEVTRTVFNARVRDRRDRAVPSAAERARFEDFRAAYWR